MTFAIVVLVAAGSLWLPRLVERLLEERSLPGGFENETGAWARWRDALRAGEGKP